MVGSLMKSNLKVLIILILSCLLQSCSSYKSKFNCNPATGVGCLSMSKTYELIKSGEIDKVDIDIKKQKKFNFGKKV